MDQLREVERVADRGALPSARIAGLDDRPEPVETGGDGLTAGHVATGAFAAELGQPQSRLRSTGKPKEHGMTSTAHPNIFPALRYHDANAAIEWLERAFGFQEKAVYRGEDGAVNHAELALGAGLVMLGQSRPEGWLGGSTPDARASTASIYIVVADPDAHYERARAAGAEIVRELTDEDYGSREYSARDPEGNLWSFGTYDPYDDR